MGAKCRFSFDIIPITLGHELNKENSEFTTHKRPVKDGRHFVLKLSTVWRLNIKFK